MAVYIVTGKLGNGKTLVSVGRIRDALNRGCRVATNLDIDLKGMYHRQKKNVELLRIPDKPTISDLEAIGRGYQGKVYDESKFGLLVLDECGTWFNSRNWQDKSRAPVIDWFLHARKLGWHVYIIVQDIKLIDSQARDALAEFVVFCRRLDNLRIPLIGPLIKLVTGFNLRLPRMHRAKVTYSDSDLVSDVWWYRGDDLFPAYDTMQVFRSDYPHSVHSLLTPWHIYGRHSVKMTWGNIMRITKIYWRRFRSPVALATGLLLGAFAMVLRAGGEAPAVSTTANTSQPPEYSSPAPVLTMLEGLRIRGSMEINGHIYYQFTHRDSDEHQYINEDVLKNNGVSLASYGTCHVQAAYRGQIVPIFCL